ncbi:putative quinol monooxygenase [Leisingera caerulea]|uniref:putative quinol monooxygenase n=1 Tax=Leisingera caerulea TaxID=506591 RepID=UPI003F4A8FA4
MERELVLVWLKPLPERFANLAMELREMINETRAFPGCLEASLAVSEEYGEIVIQHAWQSRAAQDRYLEWRADRGDLIRISEMLDEEQYFRTFKLVEPE